MMISHSSICSIRKEGNTQGGKKEPREKENFDKNCAEFNSIIDRMLLDSHEGSRIILRLL